MKDNAKNERVKNVAFTSALLVGGIVLWGLAKPAVAQAPRCCPAGTTLEGEGCSHTNWMGYKSHCRLSDCGVACSGSGTGSNSGGSCVSRVCQEGWSLSGDACEHSNWMGYKSHCRLSECGTCPAGTHLDTARGMCCP